MLEILFLDALFPYNYEVLESHFSQFEICGETNYSKYQIQICKYSLKSYKYQNLPYNTISQIRYRYVIVSPFNVVL